MRLSGGRTLDVPRAQVWEALTDPAALRRTVPGCDRLERTGPGVCELTVTTGAASLHGTYAGTVEVADRRVPERCVLGVRAAGGPGTVAGEATVELSEADGGAGTRVGWTVDVELGGRLAGVGRRLVASVAERTIGDFLDRLAEPPGGRAPEPGAGGDAARPEPAATGRAPADRQAPGAAVPAADRRGPTGQGPEVEGSAALRLTLAFLAGVLAALLGVRLARRRRGRAGP